MSAFEISAIRWWIDTSRNVSPLIFPPPPSIRAAWIIYTDAASLAEIISAVAFKGAPSGFRSVSAAFTSTVPTVWKSQFRLTNIIFGFELLSPAAFPWTWRRELAGKRVTISIDNSAALPALIRGDSVSGVAEALVAT